MPQYLLSVWHDEDYVVDFSTPDAQRVGAKVGAFNDELRSKRAESVPGLHNRMLADGDLVGGQTERSDNLEPVGPLSAESGDKFGNSAVADESDLHRMSS